MEVARRQLDTAIELWFHDRDEISVHALAYAAHEIIHRLYRGKGLKDLLFDSRIVKENHRSEINRELKKDANFLKHAERETKQDDEIEFNPNGNLIFIMMCIIGLERMGKKCTLLEDAFMFWLGLHFPEWFPEDGPHHRNPVDILNKLRSLSRREFLESYSEVWREYHRHAS